MKVLFMIYADLECLLGKIDTCQNDPRKSFTEKKAEHTPSGYSWVTCCSFDKSKNEWGHYRGKNCMERFCKDLRDQAMKIIDHEKKEMIQLTDEEKESYEKQKVCYTCEKEFSTDKKWKERKEKKPYQNVILFVLNIIDYIANLKNVLTDHKNQ